MLGTKKLNVQYVILQLMKTVDHINNYYILI